MDRLTEQSQRLKFRMKNSQHRLPRLFAMTDETRSDDPLALIDRLPKGTGLVFRHYGASNRLKIAHDVVKMCRKREILCLIAGDPRIALALGADGVHLPERMLGCPPYGLNLIRQRGGILTAAIHSRSAALTALKRGVDALFVSPVFATQSHPGQIGLGITRFALLIRGLVCPVFALGGQSLKNATRVQFAGASGMAGIGLFEEKTSHVEPRKIG